MGGVEGGVAVSECRVLQLQASDAIRIKGHRIGIEHVLSYYHEGYTPDEIAKEFPGLSLEKIYATITYYLRHRAEVDAYFARLRKRYERESEEWAAEPPPLVQRLRAIQEQSTWWTARCGLRFDVKALDQISRKD